MAQIRITRGGQQWGPYEIEDVNAMLATGQLTGHDLAWTEGLPGWIPLSGLPGVNPSAAPVAVPVPARPGSMPPSRHGWDSAPKVTSAAAVLSLVFGVMALMVAWMPLLGIPGAIVAIVLGHVARSSIRRPDRGLTGDGLAMGGLVTGYLGLLIPLAVAGWVFWVLKEGLAKYEEKSRATVGGVLATRGAFQTTLLRQEREEAPAAVPPGHDLRLVKYPGPLGPMDAYVSAGFDDPVQLPAIIWLTGGFSNSIGANAWTPGPSENDQSATSFQTKGLIVMYPSLRGGNRNPGHKEGLFGEVEDVLAAVQWLRAQPGVKPGRIYLGGHSTGGTLALLVAEATTELRAVFAFGPVAHVKTYGAGSLPYDVTDPAENEVRSPIAWLAAINCPTFVIEGRAGTNNLVELVKLRQSSNNPHLQFFEIEQKDHFATLQPLSMMLARMILTDTGSKPVLPVTDDSIRQAFRP